MIIGLIFNSSPGTYSNSGSSRQAEKHEIYTVAFGGHHFYDLFLQDRGDMAPLPPGSATVLHTVGKNTGLGIFNFTVGGSRGPSPYPHKIGQGEDCCQRQPLRFSTSCSRTEGLD